ncbi:hypothetical protein M9Y10_034693 [Tritrichomonas musculus]|uniref:Uncharacterized protein n=1 Tax=Tritrichomonas musculus TaxID=1915356 RepID=A0ABR2KHP2_9EUKA
MKRKNLQIIRLYDLSEGIIAIDLKKASYTLLRHRKKEQSLQNESKSINVCMNQRNTNMLFVIPQIITYQKPLQSVQNQENEIEMTKKSVINDDLELFDDEENKSDNGNNDNMNLANELISFMTFNDDDYSDNFDMFFSSDEN